jgi:DNA-directed RNA polymerase subunit RPC12/RpoP
MCIKCTFIKWEHSDYNFCPYCGERIKSTFVPNVKDMTLSTNSPHTIKKEGNFV